MQILKMSCCKLKECCCKLKHQKYARALKEGGSGYQDFYIFEREAVILFLGLCDYSDKFPKMFLQFVRWGIPFKRKFLSSMAVFIIEDALSVWANLGKHSLFVSLFVPSVKTGTRRIICLHELSSVVGRSSRTTEDSSSRRIKKQSVLINIFRKQF